MQVIVQHRQGAAFEVEAGGHKIVSDQPAAAGGSNLGMTPPELLLASLGTCAGYYAAEYLRARDLPVQGLTVKVSAEKLLGPARLDQFHIEVECAAEVEDRHREGLLRAVKRCLVHNTLAAAPSVQIEILTPATI